MDYKSIEGGGRLLVEGGGGGGGGLESQETS